MNNPSQQESRFEDALLAHDQLVAHTGIDLWLGAEPTFADRFSSDLQWQTTALGIEKEEKARQFVRQIAAETPGCVILRTLGRQYPGESKPRWNIGIYSRRDGAPIWSGPTDPIVGLREPASEHLPDTVRILRSQLASELQDSGFHIHTELPTNSWGLRLLFALDPKHLQFDWTSDPQVTRPPIQSQPVPLTGTVDELAARGVFLVAIGSAVSQFVEDRHAIQLELPDFGRTDVWQKFLDALSRASARTSLKSLVLTGFPPPVDDEVAWTTVTPDPGVIEVNMAPCPNVSTFYAAQQQLHRAAKAIGLSSFKLLFNGEMVDSGGGQHLTFGGPAPETSPFFKCPHLLPRLVAYLNRHPVLSYWFAVRSVGSCGQQPRADEVSPESLDGLAVALDRLFHAESTTSYDLWHSLAQFLCDRFGNTHRCEVNVEKLWNSNSPARGCLGLVELRAFRMMRSAEHAAAVAVLMRTLIAWLSIRREAIDLIEWGSQLHDRFALPYYLLRDLDAVISDLKGDGFGLDETIVSQLADDSHVEIGTSDLGSARLTLRQGIEFWPVVGNPDGTERSFRMMDSSTLRVEIMLELSDADSQDAANWRLSFHGLEVPWVIENETSRTVLLRGVRYKAFYPQTTVSPLVEVIDPLEFCVTHTTDHRSWRIQLFNWQPDAMPYDGLPGDFEVALQRRKERLRVSEIDELPAAKLIHPSAVSKYCVDLRRIISSREL